MIFAENDPGTSFESYVGRNLGYDYIFKTLLYQSKIDISIPGMAGCEGKIICIKI